MERPARTSSLPLCLALSVLLHAAVGVVSGVVAPTLATSARDRPPDAASDAPSESAPVPPTSEPVPSPDEGPTPKPEEPPAPQQPEALQLPPITLGSDEGSDLGTTWLGFAEYEEHASPDPSEVDQAPLALEAASSGSPPSPPPIAQAAPVAPTPDALANPDPAASSPSIAIPPESATAEAPSPSPATQPSAPQETAGIPDSPLIESASSVMPPAEAPSPRAPPPSAAAPMVPPPAAPSPPPPSLQIPDELTLPATAAVSPDEEQVLASSVPAHAQGDAESDEATRAEAAVPTADSPDPSERDRPVVEPLAPPPTPVSTEEAEPTEQPISDRPPAPNLQSMPPGNEWAGPFPRFGDSPDAAPPTATQPQSEQAELAPAPAPQQPAAPLPPMATEPEPTPPQPPSDDPPGELSDRESDFAAIQEAVTVRFGRPLSTKGLEIKTVRPRYSQYTKLTATPRSPVIKVRFDQTGRVVSAEYVRTSGYTDVDRPLLDAIYQWRAAGSTLELLGKPGRPKFVELTFRIIL